MGASYSSPTSLPLTSGILGDVATSLSTANVANIHRDPNFDFDVDTQLDKSSQAALVLPITVHDGLREKSTSKGLQVPNDAAQSTLIGVIQILRTRRGKIENPFTSSDLNAVRDYANSIMPSLNDWQKFQAKVSRAQVLTSKTAEAARTPAYANPLSALSSPRPARLLQKLELASITDTLRSNEAAISSLEEQMSIQEVDFKKDLVALFGESNAALTSLLSMVASASSASLSPNNDAFSTSAIASILPSSLPALIPSISAVRFMPLDPASSTFQLSETVSYPYSTGITGTCIAKHATVQVDNVSEDAYFNAAVDTDPSSDPFSGSLPTCLLLLPLSHDSEILAVVQIFSREPLDSRTKATVTTLLHTISSLLQMVDSSHAQQLKNADLLNSLSKIQDQVVELSDNIASDIDCLDATKEMSTFFSTAASTNLSDVMTEISKITSSLFSCEFSTVYKLEPPHSLVTYNGENEVVVDVSCPIQNRCLSAKHPLRLTKEEVSEKAENKQEQNPALRAILIH